MVTFALRLSALQEAGDGVSAVLRALPHAGDDAALEQGTPRGGDGIHVRLPFLDVYFVQASNVHVHVHVYR